MDNRKKLYIYGSQLKIIAYKKEIHTYENLLYYVELEREQILSEIKSHPKELEVYENLKKGITAPHLFMYSNIYSLLACDKFKQQLNEEIKSKQETIKRLNEKVKNALSGNNYFEESNM